MAHQRDYYQILQISPQADPAVVKAAYYTHLRVLKKHPDLGGSHEEATLLNEAYEILSDPSRRKAYDQKMLWEKNSPRSAASSAINVSHPDQEQRRAVRLFFQYAFRFRRTGKDWVEGQFQDISKLGACLRSLEKFKLGEMLELDISQDPLVRATAKVRWVRLLPQKFGSPLYEGGIEFDKINPTAFYQFLKKMGLGNLL